MNFFKIYTGAVVHGSDSKNVGACSAVILDYSDKVVSTSVQRHYSVTKNKIEISAAISGLSGIATPENVIIYTDLEYLRNMINLWIPQWKKYNWTKRGGEEIANLGLVRSLDDQIQRHKSVKAIWIKSDGKNEFNSLAKSLAGFELEADDFDSKIGVKTKY